MTESTRNPIGPPPRRAAAAPAVQNLVKANRDSAPAEAAAPAQKSQPASASKQITFYMAVDDLKRAKAAYTATSGQEMDRAGPTSSPAPSSWRWPDASGSTTRGRTSLAARKIWPRGGESSPNAVNAVKDSIDGEGTTGRCGSRRACTPPGSLH